jgi:5,10-methylene-tetrahydrofolate dehydrogenase/methenyl tetrahydrofolate cyclohydrolase
MSTILDGNRVRDRILRDLGPRVAALAAASRPPGLAVVLVGNDPGSQIYVRNKVKACAELGIASQSLTPPATIATEELLAIVEDLNRGPISTASWCNCLCRRRWIRGACCWRSRRKRTWTDSTP